MRHQAAGITILGVLVCAMTTLGCGSSHGGGGGGGGSPSPSPSPSPSSAPVITTASPLPDAVSGTPYMLQFTATGGTPPYHFAIATGQSLPAGLTLADDGLLSGTPQPPGLTMQPETFSVTLVAGGGTSRAYQITVH